MEKLTQQNFPAKVEKLYDQAYSKPAFGKNIENILPDTTILDLFAIPLDLVESQEKFLEWFEPRFIELRKPEDFQKFSDSIQEAAKIINENKFLLSPRIGEPFGVSPSVLKRVAQGFHNLEDVLSFFKKVAVENTPENFKDFVSPNRRSKAGAEKLSVCRILSIAYVLDNIKQNQDFRKFLEYSHFILGRSPENEIESGILATLSTPREPSILKEPENPYNVFSWLEKNETFIGCKLNNIGESRNKQSFFIDRVDIGTKSGARSFFKMLRDPESEFSPLDDFLRMRFIFDNNTSEEAILDVLYALQEEAKTKTKTPVKIKFREKNYLDSEQINYFFPNPVLDKDGKKKENYRSGYLDEIKIDSNPSGAKNYRNMSCKIGLFKNKNDNFPFFSFEIQFMREKELAANEAIESASNHFLLTIKQVVWEISRMIGKATEEEITTALKDYINFYVKTEAIPEILIGAAKYPEEYGSDAVIMEFSGTINEKAKKLYDFLLLTGNLRKVAADFPKREEPTRETRDKSPFVMSERARKTILGLLGLWIKKKNDKDKK